MPGSVYAVFSVFDGFEPNVWADRKMAEDHCATHNLDLVHPSHRKEVREMKVNPAAGSPEEVVVSLRRRFSEELKLLQNGEWREGDRLRKFCDRWRGLLEGPPRFRMAWVLALTYPDIHPGLNASGFSDNKAMVMAEIEDAARFFQQSPVHQDCDVKEPARILGNPYLYAINSNISDKDEDFDEVLYGTKEEAILAVKEKFAEILEDTEVQEDGGVVQWMEHGDTPLVQIRRFRAELYPRRSSKVYVAGEITGFEPVQMEKKPLGEAVEFNAHATQKKRAKTANKNAKRRKSK